MEMIPCFTDVLHVPNLSTAEHLMAVIRKSGVRIFAFVKIDRNASDRLLVKLVYRISQRAYQEEGPTLGWDIDLLPFLHICWFLLSQVKKLLGLLDMVAQTGESERARKLLAKLEEEMFVEYQ